MSIYSNYRNICLVLGLLGSSALLTACGSGSSGASGTPDNSTQTSDQDLTPNNQTSPTQPAAALPVETPTGDNETLETVVPANVNCDANPEQFRQAMLQAANTSRALEASCGGTVFSATGALIWNDQLADAALAHSNDMGSNNFFDHTGSDGLSAGARVTAQGYQFSTYGENIAAGQTSAQSVQNSWMSSPGHCSNIMNPSFTEMGAACITEPGSDFSNYWTVVFGAPR